MVSKAFLKCVEIIEKILEDGYKLEVTEKVVNQKITLLIGMDKRTHQKYIQTLLEFAFLKPKVKNQNNMIFTVNIEKVEKFLRKELREKLVQPTLMDGRFKLER